MAAILTELLPKLVDIQTAYRRISYDDLKPLSLPPVVAVTKAAMFVPEGSIRAGKVTDLVEDAQDVSVTKYILEGLLALIALGAFLPSGGTSIGIGIGLASAALSTTSALRTSRITSSRRCSSTRRSTGRRRFRRRSQHSLRSLLT